MQVQLCVVRTHTILGLHCCSCFLAHQHGQPLLQGHIVSKSRLQKWREEASSGSGAGASVNHPIEVLLRHSDMFSKERVEMHEVKVNLRTATENETAGQAGVDPAIFSVRPCASQLHRDRGRTPRVVTFVSSTAIVT